jgi:hypothetical protein
MVKTSRCFIGCVRREAPCRCETAFGGRVESRQGALKAFLAKSVKFHDADSFYLCEGMAKTKAKYL